IPKISDAAPCSAISGDLVPAAAGADRPRPFPPAALRRQPAAPDPSLPRSGAGTTAATAAACVAAYDRMRRVTSLLRRTYFTACLDFLSYGRLKGDFFSRRMA